jgi:hypothetical protein
MTKAAFLCTLSVEPMRMLSEATEPNASRKNITKPTQKIGWRSW